MHRKIICTQAANDLVHHVGPSFLSHMKEFVGGDYADIVRAYFVAAGVFRLRELFRGIEQAALAEDSRLSLQLDVVRLGRRSTRWLLRHFRGRLAVGQLLGRFGPIATDLSRQPEIIEQPRMARLLGMGVDEPLARQLAGAEGAVDALPIIELCERTNVPPATIAPVYARIGELLDTDWLVGQLSDLAPTSHWQAMERDAIVDELLTHQGQICSRGVLEATGHGQGSDAIGAKLAQFETQRAPFVSAWREVVSDARRGGTEFALYSMSARKLNELVRML